MNHLIADRRTGKPAPQADGLSDADRLKLAIASAAAKNRGGYPLTNLELLTISRLALAVLSGGGPSTIQCHADGRPILLGTLGRFTNGADRITNGADRIITVRGDVISDGVCAVLPCRPAVMILLAALRADENEAPSGYYILPRLVESAQ